MVPPLIRFMYAHFRPHWVLKWVYTVQPLLTGQVIKGIYQSPKNIVNKISLLTGHLTFWRSSRRGFFTAVQNVLQVVWFFFGNDEN